jgi:hypothetical protein
MVPGFPDDNDDVNLSLDERIVPVEPDAGHYKEV